MLINFHNLIDYAGKNLRSKKFVHGESIFNSGNIHKCGTVANPAPNSVTVRSICLQSSHVREFPFEINGEIGEGGKIEPFKCTCGAGTMCKHIVATLLHCLYYELPAFSSTDLECSWNEAKTKALANYQPMPIREHSCFSDDSPKTDLRLKDLVRKNHSTTIAQTCALTDILPSVVNSNCANVAENQNGIGATALQNIEIESSHSEPCDEIVSEFLCDRSVQDVIMPEELVSDDMHEGAALEGFCKQVFMKNLPKSMFVKHEVKRHEPIKLPEFTKVSSHERELYKRIFLNRDCELIEMLKLLNVGIIEKCCEETLEKISKDALGICEKTRNYFDEWLNGRKYIITGTTCYPLYTYTRNQKTPDKWKSKCNNFIEPASFTNDATEYGIKSESKAREIFKNDNPSLEVIGTGLIKCPTIEWLGVSPDGVIFKDQKPLALLEIKCFLKGKTKNVSEVAEDQIGKCLEKVDDAIVLKHNHKFYGQVQLGMALLKVDLTYFVFHSSFEKKNLVLEIPKDITFLNNMLPTLKNLYYLVFLPEICLRKSKHPDDSCHRDREHFSFKAKNVNNESKKSKSKNLGDKTKKKSLTKKNSTKKPKRVLSSDDGNSWPKKKLKAALRL